MCTLDDKILGEKLHYYCSSSEGEDNDDDDEEAGEGGSSIAEESTANTAAAAASQPPVGRQYNTGPKGVLADYKHFKEMEAERREKVDEERIQQAKKSITARSWAADEEAKRLAAMDEDDEDEEFLEAYRRQRMTEIAEKYQKSAAKTTKTFGAVHRLDRETFIDAVDDEDPLVTVIVLITESNRRGCREMEAAFRLLPPNFVTSKFCVISAADVGTSLKFKMEALPAIIVYKGGDVIGNFIRLCDDLGDDVCVSDLEGFLIDHGMISATEAIADASVADRAEGGRVDAAGWRTNAAGKDDSDEDYD